MFTVRYCKWEGEKIANYCRPDMAVMMWMFMSLASQQRFSGYMYKRFYHSRK